jgi:hypothetical protein
MSDRSAQAALVDHLTQAFPEEDGAIVARVADLCVRHGVCPVLPDAHRAFETYGVGKTASEARHTEMNALLDAARRWLTVNEAGVFADAHRRAFRRPGYVDVDAAILGMGRLTQFAGWGVRSARHLQQVLDESPVADRYGIVKRLLAAFTSAAARGGVDWVAEPLGEPWEEHAGLGWETFRRVRLTISNGGGVWSARAYRMTVVVTVVEDEWGVHSWSAGRGVARVTSRSRDRDSRSDATLFGGHAVGQAIASLFFREGLARNAMGSWCFPPREAPAWHGEALRGLAQIVTWAADRGDASGAFALTAYLAGEYVDPSPARNVLLLDKVISALGRSERAGAIHAAYAAWKDEPSEMLSDKIADAFAGDSDWHPGHDDMWSVIHFSAGELERQLSAV